MQAPGSRSDGLMTDVLPHTAAVGNICGGRGGGEAGQSGQDGNRRTEGHEWDQRVMATSGGGGT